MISTETNTRIQEKVVVVVVEVECGVSAEVISSSIAKATDPAQSSQQSRQRRICDVANNKSTSTNLYFLSFTSL
jgi:hypothetical protein